MTNNFCRDYPYIQNKANAFLKTASMYINSMQRPLYVTLKVIEMRRVDPV